MKNIITLLFLVSISFQLTAQQLDDLTKQKYRDSIEILTNFLNNPSEIKDINRDYYQKRGLYYYKLSEYEKAAFLEKYKTESKYLKLLAEAKE